MIKKTKIGIPRALFYWKKPYFWESFFENLGLEVILSPETNKEIVEKGVGAADPEACFATKVFFGHILFLEGKVDYIFVPRLKTNEEKLEYCPKFFGIPELAQILVKTRILTETFDERKREFKTDLKKLGEKLNKDPVIIEKAIKAAFLKEKELEERQKKDFFKKIKSKKQKVVLISHPYNLYDDYVNVGIKKKLEKLDTEVIFINEISIKNQKGEGENQKVDYPDFHWEFGKEMMEKIQEILKYPISGAIEISSFLCGCDAVLKEFVEKVFKQNKVPFLYLIIDEQTADAGVQTRLEAFIDTIK
ncbi:hypothetical protein KJA15_03690 [Patescibacteria group bacterium]|nr:hypothetical protein [Patescibacteria group bacterium]